MESSHESDSSSVSKDSERLRIKKLPVAVILLVELCERLTYYTLAGTQKIYFQNQLQKTPSTSAALNSVFSMLCYFWCIPGGLLADSLGRYLVIIGSGLIYALGTICVGIAVIHQFQESLGWLFTVGCLVLIAAGTGGIKPNIANFGADQIGDSTAKQRECQKTFFSLFYLSINVGVLVAFGFLTNITTGGLPGIIPQEDGYAFSYGAGAGCMILAVLLFVSFTASYRRLPGNGLGPAKRLVRYQLHSVSGGGGWRAAVSAVGFACLPIFYLEGAQKKWRINSKEFNAGAVLGPRASLGRLGDPTKGSVLRRLGGDRCRLGLELSLDVQALSSGRIGKGMLRKDQIPVTIHSNDGLHREHLEAEALTSALDRRLQAQAATRQEVAALRRHSEELQASYASDLQEARRLHACHLQREEEVESLKALALQQRTEALQQRGELQELQRRKAAASQAVREELRAAALARREAEEAEQCKANGGPEDEASGEAVTLE
ncbi:unnamed protein product [Effrenium voratum]|nr:unnamed protein product [Effrenium voratum]